MGVLLLSLLFGLAHLTGGPSWLADGSSLPLDLMYTLIVLPMFGLVAGALYLTSGHKLVAPYIAGSEDESTRTFSECQCG
jgi:membrane protease YdiL (CAAX protease family)